MAVALAVIAAVVFAFGTVLQQKGALETSAGANDPRFYLQILERPVWLLGITCNAVGALIQLAALAQGPLVVVQPILTLSLVFALPLGHRLTGQQLGRQELVGAVAVVTGIVVFLVFGQPAGGIDDPPGAAWVVGGTFVLLSAGAITLGARRRSPAVTAGLLGAAAGACYALSSSVAKLLTGDLADGIVAVLTDWPVYALAVVALLGQVLQQASLKAGVLPPAMATVNVANLMVSVVLGVAIFEEVLSQGEGDLLLGLGGLALTVCGVLTLMGIPIRRASRRAAPQDADANVRSGSEA